MTTQPESRPFKPGRHEQRMPEREHDAYKQPLKLSEPTVCPDCGAVYHTGRWQWLPRPAQASEVVCPACHRTRDRFPAGYVNLEGDFLQIHRDEILGLLSHHEARARNEHPMERIIAIEDEPKRITITTTDIHLARDLGQALRDAYQGDLTLRYSPDEYLLRVHWKR